MNGEAGYDTIKLKLADIVRGAMQLAREREHGRNAARGQELLARLAEDRFQLAVVGRFNGGKSSLMNAVVGQALLPTGIRPLTSVITSLCYGSRPGIEVRFRNGSLPARASLDQLAKYATEDGNPANRKEVQSVIVRAPLEVLRNGFYFVDTPGIGSDIITNTAATERFLPDADAIIFVTSFDSPLQPDEEEFLGCVRRYAAKVFYVVNKADLVPEPDRARILDSILGRIKAHAADPESIRLFALSARDALDAKLAGSKQGLDTSGLPDFESALWVFLTEGKSREFLTRIAGRTGKLLDEERFYLSIAEAGAGRNGCFKKCTGAISREATGLEERTAGTVRRELSEALEPEVNRWAEDQLSAAAEPSDLSNDKLLEDVRQTLMRGWNAWTESQSRSLASLVLVIAGAEIREILNLPDRPKQAAAELLGFTLPAHTDFGGADLLERTRLVFAAAPEPHMGGSRSWWKFGRRARMQAVEQAVRAYAQKVRERTLEAALDWTDRLFRESWTRYQAESAAVLSAFESQTIEADELVLDRLSSWLEAAFENISRLRPPDPTEVAATKGPGCAGPARCLICARVAAAVYDLLSHDQYLLATDPERQTEHAREGGFCTMHAWQYESIASPQGLCLAYAPVLDARARELSAASAETDTEALSRGIDTALPAAKGCRICNFISQQERIMASEVAVRLATRTDEPRPGLCILHVRSVLNAGLSPENAGQLLRAEAETLDRCARDMRMYALKHDAVRRDLATTDEQTAYRRGLSWVAGERAIALPWPTS